MSLISLKTNTIYRTSSPIRRATITSYRELVIQSQNADIFDRIVFFPQRSTNLNCHKFIYSMENMLGNRMQDEWIGPVPCLA